MVKCDKCKNKNKLIKKLNEYIAFLTKEIDKTSMYLSCRNQGASQESIEIGKKLRNEIGLLKKKRN